MDRSASRSTFSFAPGASSASQDEGAPATAAALPAPPADAAELAAIDTAGWRAVLAAPPEQGSAWMRAAARLGHAEAQAVLGQWLLDGRGVARDAVEALHWFHCAAQLGHPMAMNMAGRCHEQGWGVAVDAAKAAHWWRRAIAAADLAPARYNLANLLAEGRGVVRDETAARELYAAAAAQGYAKAWAKLGRYHEDGTGVPRDAQAAFDCYRRGAEGGDFRGQFCYAGMLAARGREREALAWLARVEAGATVGYLRQAGERLCASPQPAIRAAGARMLERARTLSATD